MRKSKVFLLIGMLSIVFLTPIYSIKSIPYTVNNSNSSTRWTIMAYLSGDNDLEGYAYNILNQLEQGKKADNEISILALIDQSIYYNKSEACWCDTRLYEIRSGSSSKIESILIQNFGELNLGSKKTLEILLNYSFTNFPADHYMFLGFNHGGGVLGWSSDYNNGKKSNDKLTMWEFRRAFEISESIIGRKIDIISLMACNMGYLEVAYQLRNVTDYYIAQQMTSWSECINWKKLIRFINKNSNVEPEQLCIKTCSIFRSTFRNFKYKTTISAIQLSHIDDVISQINQFSSNLSLLLTSTDFNNLIDIIENTKQYSYVGRDLIGFTNGIYEFFIEDSNHSLLTDSAIHLVEYLEEAIIQNSPHFTLKGKSFGLNIFFPFPHSNWNFFSWYDNSNPTFSLDLDFVDDSNWVNFLGDFYTLDTDYDLMPDWYEYKYQMDPLSNDTNNNSLPDRYEDYDNDDLYNLDEFNFGSNPYLNDTDSDGLSDYEEITVLETKPFLVDSDFDTIPDNIEIRNGKDPNEPDSMVMDYYHGQSFLKYFLPPIVLVIGVSYFSIRFLRKRKRNKN